MAISSGREIQVGGWQREHLRANLTKAGRRSSLEATMTFFLREYVSYGLGFVNRVAVSDWHVKTFAIVAHRRIQPS